MYVVIVGCGRVGSAIAAGLVRDGHRVAVIDEDEDALLRLGEDFSGDFFHGVGLDIDLLERAGPARADAFGAAPGGDNTRLVAARRGRERVGASCGASRVV